jgi:hypothetical protein
MRHLIVTTTVTVALAGQLLGQARRSPPPDVGVGRIAWFDISSTNLTQAKDFYGKLFDWTFTPVEGTDKAFEIIARGTAIGTLRSADGQISAFNGVVYVQVNDLQASCSKARELGATVPKGFPFNLTDGTGAICLAVDLSGHPVGMYSRARLPSKSPPR